MSRILIINRQNNLGDAICLMRGIKEWKEQNDHVVDFVSVFPMHLEAAWHTDDLFESVKLITHEKMYKLIKYYSHHGYDEVMYDFNMDWTSSTRFGIVNSYCKLNFGFFPSTSQPLFQLQYDEIKIARFIADRLRGVGWKKLVFIQALAVSNPARCIPFDDIYKVCSLFPEDTLIMMPCGVHDPYHVTLNPFPKNVLVMPGFPVGHSAALMKNMDLNLMVHGAYSHIAYAVNAPNVVQLNFYETGSINFEVPGGNNLNFKTSEEDYITPLKETIDRILVG